MTTKHQNYTYVTIWRHIRDAIHNNNLSEAVEAEIAEEFVAALLSCDVSVSDLKDSFAGYSEIMIELGLQNGEDIEFDDMDEDEDDNDEDDYDEDY